MSSPVSPLQLSLGNTRPWWVELASPAPGLSMIGRVKGPGATLRRLASQLAVDLSATDIGCLDDWLMPRAEDLGSAPVQTGDPVRAAWLLLAMWLTGFAVDALKPGQSILDAVEWFAAGRDVPLVGLDKDSTETARLGEDLDADACAALLPYLLDPLAPGTRRAVLRSEEERSDRHRRKREGIFYTPADVAYFMATLVLQSRNSGTNHSILDPAAGSGVFLRAADAARTLGRPARLYGIDVNPLAADFTSFVLLASREDVAPRSPWSRWHQFRLNQATVDALSLVGLSRPRDDVAHQRRLRERAATLAALMSDERPPAATRSVRPEFLDDAFPELADGVDVVLSNPPYAPLGDHPAATTLGQRFRSSGGDVMSPSANIYPLFVEQGTHWLSPHGSLAMVTPLSITFSSTAQIRGLRRALSAISGRLEFMSFDRTPDALFGDDVKTRNTIVVVRKGEPSSVWTTGLLRWTSRTRSAFLGSLEPIAVSPDIGTLVPKADSVEAYNLYAATRQRSARLNQWVVKWCRANPGEGGNGEPSDSLYFAPTAYNWLNVVVDLRRLSDLGHSSVCDYQGAEFRSDLHRYAAYAIASSRLAYLLWCIEGDGFHLTRAFIRQLPVPDGEAVAQLSQMGHELWAEASGLPVLSSNAGRQSVSLPPTPESRTLAAIDGLLVRSLGLTTNIDLRRWHEARVVVDAADERRQSHFDRRSHDAARGY